MTPHFKKFISVLSELFMLDQAELDFGIYRILNQKRADIEQYLYNDLEPQVRELLQQNSQTGAETDKAELQKLETTLLSAGIDPETSPKVLELRAKLTGIADLSVLEGEVFSHLATFFRRYYEGGDFMSMRRYKKDVYAIPYEGEEVKLHWANADQYYIKTGEYFQNYTFKLADDRLVHFKLRDASTEQNNNKAQADQERRFKLADEDAVEVIGDELNIYFTYNPMPKGIKQKDLQTEAFQTLKSIVPAEFITQVLAPAPTESLRNRTLLEKHINDYVSRNSFDYFIHKDLGAFLRRELDFYLKNEVLFIDDINARRPEEFLQYLAQMKTIKAIGDKLITFLAQLEDFQKKLWLKKKMVVETNYCITLDRVPRHLYSQLIACDEQRAEWVRLFAIDEIRAEAPANNLFGETGKTGYTVPLTEAFLLENPFLVLDTVFFTEQFKQQLLAGIDNFEEQLDGTLINSENFQALNLLQEKYKEEVNGTYVDPPYNTSASEIVYKNNYKESSWLSMIQDRFVLGRNLLKFDSVQCSTIDDAENNKFQQIIEQVFGVDNIVGVVPIKINPSGRPTERGFALTHEYAIFSAKTNKAGISKIPRTNEQLERFDQKDKDGIFEFRNLRREGSNSDRENGQRQFYPIYGNLELQTLRVPKMEWIEEQREWIINEKEYENEVVIFPINDAGREKNWRWSEESVRDDYSQFIVRIPQGGKSPQVYYKYRPNMEGITPFTMWTDAKFSATEHGTKVLKDLFKESIFAYPKSIFAVEESLLVMGLKKNRESQILDYFAGSATTGHAVINLNREDEGKRKYILVEMGTYFDTVTKPRIQKVIYSKDWKEGKPVSRVGISHCMKYIRLEQFEDTLNNLIVQRPDGLNFTETNSYNEGYLLGYMLDVEARGSLFNLAWFERPFDVYLKTTRHNELKPTRVDLVETFNYLIGLRVRSTTYPKAGICVVDGTTRTGEKTLVIWRDCTLVDAQALNDFFTRSSYSTLDREFDRIYLNGDNLLQNIRKDDEHWKVVLIEEEFAKRMFEV